MAIAPVVPITAAESSQPSLRLGVDLPIHYGQGDDTEGYVPLHQINVFEQVRKTYEEIEEFANDLAHREINAVQVAIRTKHGMRKYLDLLNRLWGMSYTLKDCKRLPGSPIRYAVLISGHRRTFAKLHLWQHGCDSCREVHGQEEPGACFERHFSYGFNRVKVRLYYNITPYEAMGLQCQENIRGTVPAHEQAEGYDRLFSLVALDHPDELTIAEFVRIVGHVSAETVSRAIRFCRLPELIREDVAERRMGYGVALELGRLQEVLQLNEATLLSERQNIVDYHLSLKQYRAHVSSVVNARRSRHGAFFELSDELQGNLGVRRQVFERRTIMAIYDWTSYINRVAPKLANGEMGPNGTWPDTSAINALVKMVKAQKVLVELLEQRLTASQLDEATRVTAEVEELLQEIQLLETEPPLLNLVQQ
jgi:hypothetical protein